MDLQQLLDRAIEKAGGVRKLADKLDWGLGALSAARSGERPIPAYRAGQLAQDAGEDVTDAVYRALETSAATETERKFWAAQLGESLDDHALRLIVAEVTGDAYVFVAASAIARVLTAQAAWGRTTKKQVSAMAKKAAAYMDQHPRAFQGHAIDARRQLLADYLLGKDIASDLAAMES